MLDRNGIHFIGHPPKGKLGADTTVCSRYKREARSRCKKAVKSGLLDRPDACEQCGKVCDVTAHHEDYQTPLLVVWLCEPCHQHIHGNICKES